MFDKIKRTIRKRRALKWWKSHITKSFKDLKHHRKLTKAQKKEVDDFYISLIGHKVPLYSHEYFYSRTGYFTKEYIPLGFLNCELIPRANKHDLKDPYGDKNMCDLLFPGENIAHSILKNIYGYYYYEGKPVSEEEAIMLCQNLEKVVIKPSKETQGRGVKVFSSKDGITDIEGMTVLQLFKKYKQNYVIQEWVKQHKDMAALNPTSVNTIRILSYRSGMEVLIIYTVVRIGRMGSVTDNQSAGGISTIIFKKDGCLAKMAFGGYSEDDIEKTDTGIVLEGYKVPSYDKAVEMVKRLHLKLPFFDLVGWDVAIQEDGEPILIEFNTSPGLSQSAIKSGMGEYTERVIRELWPRPNTRFPD